MKHTKLFVSLALALLLAAALLLTGCRGGTDPADTTAPSAGDTVAPEVGDTTPETAPETTPDTEAETEPPADLTADELKALLAAALEKEVAGAGLTVRTYFDKELFSENVYLEKGDDFMAQTVSLGTTERIVAVGDKVYYYVSMVEGVSKTEVRYVITPTAEERAELYGYYMDGSASAGLDDEELTEGLLNSTLTGKRYHDGRVELSCTDLDDSLVTLLLDETMAGTGLTFDFVLDAEGRMSLFRFAVTLSAEQAGGREMVIASEVAVDYDPAAPAAPSDADAYTKAKYDDLFGFQLPEIDPEEAASLGLPVDGDNYTVGGENAAVSAEDQFYFLYAFAPYYAGKTFTVYGNVTEDEYGNIVISVGEDMDFVAYFDGVSEPMVGSYVKVTATFTQTVDFGDYVDFDCFTLMATSCEMLGEAAGPNGGKLMFITASSLNVRSTPDSSVSDNKVGLLYSGDMVEVLETGLGANSNWCKITFDCDAGYAYISMTYISETKP